jgi:Ca-activated chloride channel family protein
LIAGLLAGLVLELGLQDSLQSGFSYRLAADILLTALTGLGTLIIPIREKFSGSTGRNTGATDFSTKGTSPKRDHFKKGF